MEELLALEWAWGWRVMEISESDYRHWWTEGQYEVPRKECKRSLRSLTKDASRWNWRRIRLGDHRVFLENVGGNLWINNRLFPECVEERRHLSGFQWKFKGITAYY